MSKLPEANAFADSVEAAAEAGLRYVSDHQPGYRRKRKGDGFEYFDTEGKPIREEEKILRINRLAIPPAWTDVWICPSPNGHIQATGRDDRGRKQYRYHDRWREVRDENKYDRMIDFGKALPNIRARLRKDMALPGLPRNKVLATVIQLLERTFIRIGNVEYARENNSFGLTTLQDRHVSVKGSKLRFRFKGKSGKHREVEITDRRVAKIISKLQDLPGQDLFQYVDEDGVVHDVTSQDVNDYLREIGGGADFSAKDFRTWGGTVLAAIALRTVGAFETKKQAKANIKAAICGVAQLLGNTPAICRKCYIHPAILETYLKRSFIAGLEPKAGENGSEPILAGAGVDFESAETAILKWLRSRAVGKS
jgi:DNA topoisomerase-1